MTEETEHGPETCADDKCHICCGKAGHEWDPDEGMMCINCDSEYPW